MQTPLTFNIQETLKKCLLDIFILQKSYQQLSIYIFLKYVLKARIKLIQINWKKLLNWNLKLPAIIWKLYERVSYI